MIPVSRFVIEHTIEDAPVYDTASRVAKAMITELTIHAAENVIELFMRHFFAMTPFLDSGLVVWLYDQLSHVGKMSVYLVISDSGLLRSSTIFQ